MGYRDDETALAARRDVLGDEVATLMAQLADLEQQAVELRQQIRSRWLRLTVARIGRWIAGHPKTMVALVVVLAIVARVWEVRHRNARLERQRKEAALGTGCSARLRVGTGVGGIVFVNGARVGRVPQDVAICPGDYVVQVLHDRMIPWQQRVHVGDKPVVELRPQLIPFAPEQRPPGSVAVFTDPPGGVLFVNGRERGRAPALIRREEIGPKGLLLGIWTTSMHRPVFVWQGVPRKAAMWFHLGREGAEVAR